MFLEGVRAALTADAKFQGGWYSPGDPPVTGLRAAARVYAGWGFTQAFYWHEVLISLPLLISAAPCYETADKSDMSVGMSAVTGRSIV